MDRLRIKIASVRYHIVIWSLDGSTDVSKLFVKYNHFIIIIKGECSVIKKKKKLWMKTIHYPNTIRSHLVTIVPMAPFTPKCTSKLRSALHIRYWKVIPRFISSANTAQT